MGPQFRTIGIRRLRMLNDGEGVTTLAAGYGCPLRCKYCLNPQCTSPDFPPRSYTVEELLEEVRIDDLYFQATGGGIVFGGGEPLLFADFIHAFREKCPASWKLSLESSLAVPLKQVQRIANDIDFFLIDIKDMNPEIYRAYTEKDNKPVYENLRFLADHVPAQNVCLRIPLIPEFNTEADRENSVKILKEMGFHRFDLFTYVRRDPPSVSFR